MPERAAVFQSTQLGVETTAGTAVAATKRLLATGINFTPRIPAEPFTPAGAKFATTAVRRKEWTEGTIEGVLAFNDIVYLLSSLLNHPTPTTPTGGVLSRDWNFSPATFDADTIATYTVEMGSSAFGERFTYGIVNALTMRFSAEDLPVTGSMIGQIMTEPFTLTTAGRTDIAAIPAGPKMVDVYMGATVAGLTKLTRASSCEVSFENRHTMGFMLDSAFDSYSYTVERRPDFSARLTIQHDATSQALLANMRNVDTRFFRIVVTGGIIEGAIPYKIQITMPVKLTESERGDVDDVWQSTYTMAPVHDGGFGKAVEIVVTNTVTAL